MYIHYIVIQLCFKVHQAETSGYYKLKKDKFNKSFHFRYPVEDDSVMTYLMSYYWTILAMTTIGDLPQPKTKYEYFFVIFELLIGLFTFATVLGYIANIVTNVSAARKDFQG